jgi:hypothetical protein
MNEKSGQKLPGLERILTLSAWAFADPQVIGIAASKIGKKRGTREDAA